MTELPASIQVLERGWLSSNNILLFEGDAATLVDSGYVAHAPQTLALIKSALAGRRQPTKLTRLINTHSHSDHIGGNAAIQAAHRCRIVIPAGIEAMITHWDEDALLLTHAGQRADRFAHDAVIAPDEEFEMGGLVWRAHAAPGHDDAALVFHCEREGLLISGDALWQDGFGIVFGEILGDTANAGAALAATRRTLDRIAALDVRVVIPGHGSPFDDVDAALGRAYGRLVAFEKDGARIGRNAVKACFIFNLLEFGRMKLDELPAYLAGIPFFKRINDMHFGHDDEKFAAWLLADLAKSRAVEVSEGWILPTRAP